MRIELKNYNIEILVACILIVIIPKEILFFVLLVFGLKHIYERNWILQTKIFGNRWYMLFLINGIIIGLLNISADGHSLYSFIKHLFYFVYNFMFIMVAELIAKSKKTTRKKTIQTLMVFFAFFSCYDIMMVIYKALNASYSGVDQYRTVVGTGSFLPFLGLYIMMFYGDEIEISKNKRRLLQLVYIIAGCAHFSRTYIASFIILTLCSCKKKDLKKISKCIFAMIIIAFLLNIFSTNLWNSLVRKILYSFQEINYQTTDWNWKTINHNWRGYELYCELVRFKSRGWFEKLLGGGFGTTLSVFGYEYLVTDESSIPFLHNGYGTILMVWGIVGIFSYIFMILEMSKYASNCLKKRDRLFARALSFSILFATYFIGTGLFSSDISKWIFFLILVLKAKDDDCVSNENT